MKEPKYYFEILPRDSIFKINVKEIWDYRDLLALFVRRNIVSQYKQTILGPIWLVLQPVLTSLSMFVILTCWGKLSEDAFKK